MKSSEEIRGQRQGTPPAQEVEVVEEEEVVARDRAGALKAAALDSGLYWGHEALNN